MFRAIILTLCVALTVSACGTPVRSKKVKAMQRKDKLLTCKEILLEMNEAEFYRSTAERNKGPSVRSVLMPLGYISTYMDAEEAARAANARVDYLDRIYQIMDCDVKDTDGGSGSIFPSGNGVQAPASTSTYQNQLNEVPAAQPSAATPSAVPGNAVPQQQYIMQQQQQSPAVAVPPSVPQQQHDGYDGYVPIIQPR